MNIRCFHIFLEWTPGFHEKKTRQILFLLSNRPTPQATCSFFCQVLVSELRKNYPRNCFQEFKGSQVIRNKQQAVIYFPPHQFVICAIWFMHFPNLIDSKRTFSSWLLLIGNKLKFYQKSDNVFVWLVWLSKNFMWGKLMCLLLLFSVCPTLASPLPNVTFPFALGIFHIPLPYKVDYMLLNAI